MILSEPVHNVRTQVSRLAVHRVQHAGNPVMFVSGQRRFAMAHGFKALWF